MVYTCRWGILATGWIADYFAKDLVSDPALRKVDDVRHTITAVASSSSEQKAKDFIAQVGADKQADGTIPKAYGNYEDFVKDDNVDIIYIATPHSLHYENALLCLEAGKNVCLEKPFTVNEAQAKHLVKIAREKNLFLMEAVWIRFFPIMLEIKDLLHNKKILGKILTSHADFGVQLPSDPKHRINNPDLAGGALLDLGIYSLTWQLCLLFEHPDNKSVEPEVIGTILKGPTGVDAYTTMVFNWPQLGIQTIGTTNSVNHSHRSHSVLIQGEKGDMTIPWPTSRPTSYTLHLKNEKGEYLDAQVNEREIPGMGMFWEADGCARALRDGKKESELCPLDTTLRTMRIMDKVRQQGNFRYPEKLESVRSDA